MTIPPISNPIWTQLLLGKVHWQLESLPLKIFLGTARLQLGKDPSSAHVNQLTQDLRNVFLRNEKLPSVQKDLANFK